MPGGTPERRPCTTAERRRRRTAAACRAQNAARFSAKKTQTRRALPTEKHRPRAALDPRARMQHRPPAEKRGGTPFSAKKANAAPCLCRPGGSEMPKPKPRFCFVLKCNDAGAAQLPFENTNIARPGWKPRPCDIPAAYAPQSRETPGGQSGRRAAQSRAGHARFAAPPRSPAQRPAETAFAPPFTSAENMSTTQYSTERRRYAPAPAEKRGGTPFSAGKSNAAPYFRRPRRGTPNRSRVHAFAPRRERKQRPRRDEILTGRTLSPGGRNPRREKNLAEGRRPKERQKFCASAVLPACFFAGLRPNPRGARRCGLGRVERDVELPQIGRRKQRLAAMLRQCAFPQTAASPSYYADDALRSPYRACFGTCGGKRGGAFGCRRSSFVRRRRSLYSVGLSRRLPVHRTKNRRKRRFRLSRPV